MNEIAITILLFLSSILGVESYPTNNQQWEIVNDWKKNSEGYFLFSATNSSIAEECKNNPSFYIEFPSIIHSSSQLKINDKIIASTGLPDFTHIRGFYGSLIVPCFQLQGNEVLTWEVVSYTKYFARFHYFPRIVEHYPAANFFKESLNIAGASILLALCVLYRVLFIKKISREKLISLFFANFFTSLYFIGNSAGLMGISISMLTAHKIADSGLWLGFLFFINFLYLENLVLYWMNFAYKISTLIALIIIFTSSTGDEIQLGTTIPFIPSLILLSLAMKNLINKDLYKSRARKFQLIGLISFLISYLNDSSLVLGILDVVPIAPIGWIGNYIFILLSVNESISSTYAERDQLKILTNQLKQTNENLTRTQDELIKSEKMAVMGRAVARIAHELNTPIYLVRSSVQNIQTQTQKFLKSLNTQNPENLFSNTKQYESDLNKMTKSLMASASKAAELVKNFKEISTDQINVKKKDFQLLDYIRKSLVTMEAELSRKKIEVRLKGDEVLMHNDPGLFYQVIQNLITNVQKYAYDTGGVVDIEIKDLNDKVKITFADYGKGISEENIPKIFDAFFTTGGGSGGVGLGLNIVYKIITQTLEGEIICSSAVKSGTIFTITIPNIKTS
ncbi:MAG: sensor histidine kinase [Proteobacteria bacterium]|nr:sensor histidine kinase [Pseudomonadota bacterium]